MDATTPPTSPTAAAVPGAAASTATASSRLRPGTQYVCYSATSPAGSQCKLMALLLTRDHGWEEWPTELHTCEQTCRTQRSTLFSELAGVPQPVSLFWFFLTRIILLATQTILGSPSSGPPTPRRLTSATLPSGRKVTPCASARPSGFSPSSPPSSPAPKTA